MLTENVSTKVLLTGGAGYIGSHTVCALVQAGLVPVIFDDFSNSSPAVLDRLTSITGHGVVCERGDVSDAALVQRVIETHGVGAVMHFAGFKAVGESVAQPLKYYGNNLGSMMGLLQAMARTSCRMLVFSSTATVYGDPEEIPVTESAPRRHESPYAHTKLVIEDMLAALERSDPAWCCAVLRYFNPVGAHPSGLIGEDPLGVPNNLMPYISQVAVGKRSHLQVFGNDYPTKDGTGVRDYIHVQDLAEGHVAALRYLLTNRRGLTVNLGSGQGHSVLEVVRAFERACGKPIPCTFVDRRSGDVAEYYADPALAHELLGWRAQRSLDDMCADAWRWQQGNPDGYRSGCLR